ncbi:AMP-binding protein [Desulfoluna spongiiphila]|uniref:Acyl-CoA synthetase (AMP-forming)/AMP-acid ligase II n=1 Tax=Desulfoluna spongiiphila TaxID=419481 RepID=A0A1G5AGV2_9BACT|nr:AMP-binding protein [Desulfoluna spongiiphila]SCX77098.1 Acyl-CoA synthetase (AMP-forming)/AMP-acid ligase II [Desulfoluna spongiiphila]
MTTRRGNALPWSREYRILGIPETLEPYPDAPAYDILDRAARRFPKRGLIQLGIMLTYPEVRELAHRLATALSGFGLAKGDRVATLLPTSIQFVIADYAISRAGLVHVPCSALEPVSHLTHKFNTCTPRALITMDDTLDHAKQLAETTSVEQVVVSRLSDYSDAPEPPEPLAGFSCAAHRFTELIARSPCTPPQVPLDPRTDLEMILFTGGTTGVPKGCMLTHRNIYCNSVQNGWAFGRIKTLLQGNITALLGLPLFHSYGHVIMHTMTLEGYNQILIPDARDTESMVAMIRTHCPLLQLGVPVQFMKMAEKELKGIAVLGVSGSAPLPPSTQKKFETNAKGAIMEGYGLSEMSPCTHLNPSLLLRLVGGRAVQRGLTLTLGTPGLSQVLNRALGLLGPRILGYLVTRAIAILLKITRPSAATGTPTEKLGATGIPLPDTRVRIADTATGSPVADMEAFPPAVRGEMHLQGPQRMSGYWPEAGNGIDEAGYIRTGDVVTVDPQGYFSIVDRTKDMINVSGYKVYSREVDDILYGHPAIEHAATVGVPDGKREGSERVVICVQPKAGYKNRVTPDEFITFLKERVARYAVPRSVFFVDEMPLTAVQKLDKKKVRELARAHARNLAP